MINEIIKADSRLFILQVLEYGFNEDIIDDTVIRRLKREGTQMSFVFAKRYYSVVYESYLRHASNCVLGITNIGLIELSATRLDIGIGLLIQKGYVELFREGWTRILDLVGCAINVERYSHKTAFEWEKDFAESLSAEPERKWFGYDEYLNYKSMYCSGT